MSAVVAITNLRHGFAERVANDPLLPATIYQATGIQTRDCVQAALATTLTCGSQPRTLHQTVSASVPDEAVAAELVHVSQTTVTGRAGTLRLAERAAELTPEGLRHHHRLLGAAQLTLEMGRPDRASRVLHEIDSAGCEPLDRAKIGTDGSGRYVHGHG
jgi:hypothetical protein